MKRILENLINGNLADAKKQARHFSAFTLRGYFEDEGGMSRDRAALAADYLKGCGTFQAYCDAA